MHVYNSIEFWIWICFPGFELYNLYFCIATESKYRNLQPDHNYFVSLLYIVGEIVLVDAFLGEPDTTGHSSIHLGRSANFGLVI